MGKNSGGSPKSPDPGQTAAQQAVMNAQTARTNATLNRVNQYTPYGQSTYTDMGKLWASQNPGVAASKNPYTDQWRNDIKLSPDSEAAARAEMLNSRLMQELGTEQVGRIDSAVSQDLDFSQLPQLAGSGGYADQRKQVEDALYGRATSRLDPQFEQQARQMETQLANKGIPIGSEAWNRAMDNFNRGRNDAYAGARSDAVTGGGAEQSRLFGLDIGARQQGITEQLTKRNQPLNELAAILGGGQVSMPQFAPGGGASAAPVDYTSLVNNKYAAQNSAAQQNTNNWTNGLFGLGQAGLSAYMMS
jgi:hypothetical protein